MNLTPVAFWHEYLGRHLSPLPPEQSSTCKVMTRLKRGVDMNRLGAGIAAYYIVTPKHAWLIGKVEMPDTEAVTFVSTDGENGTSGEAYIARWLLSEQMTMPFMIGTIGNAGANASFQISQSPALVFYCETDKGWTFNLSTLRNAWQMIGGLSWWDTVDPAIRQYFALQDARLSGNVAAIDTNALRMRKILDKEPRLSEILPKLDVRPGSGEYQMLRWAARE